MEGVWTIVLLYCNILRVLFQSLISLFGLSITFRMISRSEVKLHVQCSSEGLEEVGYEFCTASEVTWLGTPCLEKNMRMKSCASWGDVMYHESGWRVTAWEMINNDMDFIEKLPHLLVHLNSSHCWSALQAVTLHPDSWYITSPQLHNSSFYMSFPSMVFQAMSLLIAVQNSYPTSSSPSELHWTWSFTSLLDIILKVMDKPNKLIRLWNSTSEYIATTNKTIGPNSFH